MRGIHCGAIGLPGRELFLQGVEANGEGLDVVSPGQAQALDCVLDSRVDGRTQLGFGCLALFLQAALDDAQLDEDMIDPAIDLGLELLMGLFGTGSELGLKRFRLGL